MRPLLEITVSGAKRIVTDPQLRVYVGTDPKMAPPLPQGEKISFVQVTHSQPFGAMLTYGDSQRWMVIAESGAGLTLTNAKGQIPLWREPFSSPSKRRLAQVVCEFLTEGFNSLSCGGQKIGLYVPSQEAPILGAGEVFSAPEPEVEKSSPKPRHRPVILKQNAEEDKTLREKIEEAAKPGNQEEVDRHNKRTLNTGFPRNLRFVSGSGANNEEIEFCFHPQTGKIIVFQKTSAYGGLQPLTHPILEDFPRGVLAINTETRQISESVAIRERGRPLSSEVRAAVSRIPRLSKP